MSAPVGMAAQVNLTWVLGEAATIPIATVWAALNVTSIVPLGAADTRVQGAMELPVFKRPMTVRHSVIS